MHSLIALKVTFQYDMVGISWSQPIDELDIKDRVVSFKIPAFPYEFNGAVQVKIVLEQEHRQIDRPVFFYLSSGNAHAAFAYVSYRYRVHLSFQESSV